MINKMVIKKYCAIGKKPNPLKTGSGYRKAYRVGKKVNKELVEKIDKQIASGTAAQLSRRRFLRLATTTSTIYEVHFTGKITVNITADAIIRVTSEK